MDGAHNRKKEEILMLCYIGPRPLKGKSDKTME